MRVALIGTGLIGGSMAWAMRRKGLCDEVTACDLVLDSARTAVRLGFAEKATYSIEEAVQGAAAVVVAVPVLAMPKVFRTLGRCLGPGAFVTDVGSVRRCVIDAARAGLGEHFADYAPVHPIAGGEMPGIDYADPSLYEGCKAISTPDFGMNSEAVAFWEDVWDKLGAKVVRMSPDQHDAIFGEVSHLPHVLAYALVDAMAKRPDAAEKFSFVGAGFRDFTRIAASSPAMWRDICLSNRAAILNGIAMFKDELELLRLAIDRGDATEIEEIFTRASDARRSFGAKAKTVEERAREKAAEIGR